MDNRQVIFTAPKTVLLQHSDSHQRLLQPDEVAGSTVASMISPGTEIHSRFLKGNYPGGSGYASVFRLEQVGEDVKNLKPGDLVFSGSNHQSYQTRNQEDVLLVPSTLNAADACMARFLGISMSTLTTTIMRPPAKVLVMGLGLVGNIASRLFDCCGYNVTAVDPVASRREQLSGNSHCQALGKPPETDDFDLAIDCSGHEQAVLDAGRCLRKGGELVLIGVPWKPRADVQAFELTHLIFHRYIHMRSGWEWELPKHRRAFDQASIWSNYAGALRWLEQKRICLDGLYEVVSPNDCQQAYERVAQPGDGPLTTVFDWTL